MRFCKDTANALVDYIIENYGDYPSFEFKRHSEISAIRSHKTGEWYAFLLGGGVEQIYLKLPEARVKELIQKDGTTIWKQKGKIYAGDIIYLYLATPISSILFKCEVIENNIPYSYEDENLKMDKVFKMKLIKKYKQGELPMDLLLEHGITWIRGQRRLPESLVREIEKRDKNGN